MYLVPAIGWPGTAGVGGPVDTTLLGVLTTLGLNGDLILCLDAGDSMSYASGQKWLDRSGYGYDFYRGTTSGAEASDPTFNGVVGGASLNEYWSFDGGDLFNYDSANETWMQNIHKDSAVFTFIFWVYVTSTSTSQFLIGTAGDNVTGFRITIDASARIRFNTRNSGTQVQNYTSTATVGTGAWKFIAIAVDEAATTGTGQINTTQESFTSTYSGPASGNATYTMQIGASGNSNGPVLSGTRIAEVAAWPSKISNANLTNIYNSTKTRFGL